MVLLGLLSENAGVASSVLKDSGIELNVARESFKKILASESGGVANESSKASTMPPSQNTRVLLELAFDESRKQSVDYIGTDHMLLGLLRLNKSNAMDFLRSHGVGLEKTRNAIEGLKTREQKDASPRAALAP